MSNKISNRISSGIPNLDVLIEGGFFKGSTCLIAGQTGTGKSIFSSQFLLEGLRNEETCVYLSLEQKTEEILKDMEQFNWGEEFKKYYNSGKLIIIYVNPSNLKELEDITFNEITKIKASRLVLDSLTIAGFGWKMSSMDIGKIRSEIYSYIKSIEGFGVTSLLISEIPENEKNKVSMFGFEEFIVDGVIVLHYLEYGLSGSPRNLMIRKMRRTNHSTNIFSIKMNNEGLSIDNE